MEHTPWRVESVNMISLPSPPSTLVLHPRQVKYLQHVGIVHFIRFRGKRSVLPHPFPRRMDYANPPSICCSTKAWLNYLQMDWSIRTSRQRFADAQDRSSFVVMARIQRRLTTQRVGVIALEYLNRIDIVFVFGIIVRTRVQDTVE